MDSVYLSGWTWRWGGVFRGYLCVGDSWAESYKLTLITETPGLNQIPLLQIADMQTDTLSSDVVIYQPGPATLNVKTFLHHVKLMRCCVRGVRGGKRFPYGARSPSRGERYPERPSPHLFPAVTSLFVDVGQVCAAFSTPNTHTHKSSRKKGMKRPSHRLTVDPWLSFEKLGFQIKLTGLKGQQGPQSCPGPPCVTEQLRGVNVHFSQLSKTCDEGKGKQRTTEVIRPTNIDSLKLVNGWRTKLTHSWNYQTSKSQDNLGGSCTKETDIGTYISHQIPTWGWMSSIFMHFLYTGNVCICSQAR